MIFHVFISWVFDGFILILGNKLKSLKVAQVKDVIDDNEDDGCDNVCDSVCVMLRDFVMQCFV